MDTAGPFPEAPGGFKYAICFYDHCTKWVAIYFLRTHYGNEVLMALKTFLLDHKRYLGNTKVPGTVDEWHTNNGTEFVNNNVDENNAGRPARVARCRRLTRRRATLAPSVSGVLCLGSSPR